MTDTTAPARKPLDLSRLTLGEVAKLEDLSGMPMARIGDEDAPQGKLLAAMVFVSERRNGNAISWPECLNIEVPEAMAMLGMDADDEPEAAPEQVAIDSAEGTGDGEDAAGE